MSSPEYGLYKPKWYNIAAKIPGVEGTLLHAGDLIAGTVGIVTLGSVKTRRSADNIAREEVDIQVVTGKDPAFNPISVLGYSAVELFFGSFAPQAIAVAVDFFSGGLLIVPDQIAQFAADIAIDSAIGWRINAQHYGRARRAGLTTTATDNAIKFAARIPWLPIGGALPFLQWYGRARARKEIRKAARGQI